MVGVTGSIPVVPTTNSLFSQHFWNHPRPDRLQILLRQQYVNSKQRPAAVLLDQCDYAIGGERDIREHFRIV
jgi:hypothetical protein